MCYPKQASLLFPKGTGSTGILRRKEKLKFKLEGTCLPEGTSSLERLRLQLLPGSLTVLWYLLGTPSLMTWFQQQVERPDLFLHPAEVTVYSLHSGFHLHFSSTFSFCLGLGTPRGTEPAPTALWSWQPAPAALPGQLEASGQGVVICLYGGKRGYTFPYFTEPSSAFFCFPTWQFLNLILFSSYERKYVGVC